MEPPKCQVGPKSFIYYELYSALYKDFVEGGFPRAVGVGLKHSLLPVLSRYFWISGSVHRVQDPIPGQMNDVS